MILSVSFNLVINKEGLEKGLQQGLQQGIQRGVEQGIEQGALNKEKEMYQKLLQQGKTIQEIAELFGYDFEYVQSILNTD